MTRQPCDRVALTAIVYKMSIRRLIRLIAAIIFFGSHVFLAACAGGARNTSPAVPADRAALPAERMSQVYELLKADRPVEAAGVLMEISRSYPEYRQARLELAYVYIRLKRWESSIILLDSLLDGEPSNMRLRMERGHARRMMGNLAAAADEFTIVTRSPSEFQDQAREALAVIAAESSIAARDTTNADLLNEGYDDLRRGDRAQARIKFTEALRRYPGQKGIVRQLGYMSIADGNMPAAAEEFAGAHRLAPRDYQTAIELGYLYDGLRDEEGAKKSFAAALPSTDPSIRSAAAGALKSIYARSDPLYLDVYASPVHSSRFANTVVYFEAIGGYKPQWSGPLSFYIATRYTQDSRSRSGATSEVYSDNFVSFGPGIKIAPRGLNLNLTAEYTGAVNILRSESHPDKMESNVRVVLADYYYWGASQRLFADAGGSVGYYSRYRGNVIAYLQLRGGVKVWDSRYFQLSLYAPVNVLKDGNRDFYNNTVEAGAGVELQPWVKLNLRLRAEYLGGAYMGIEGRDRNPYGAHYKDIRIALIYAGHFTKQRKPETFPSKAGRAFLW